MCVKRFWFSELSIYFFCFPSLLFSKVEEKWMAITGKCARFGGFLGRLQEAISCLSRKILYICMSSSGRRLYIVSERGPVLLTCQLRFLGASGLDARRKCEEPVPPRVYMHACLVGRRRKIELCLS